MATSTFTWSSYAAPTLTCGVAVQPNAGQTQLDTFNFPATLHTTGATSLAVPITIAAGHSNLVLLVLVLTDDTTNGVVTSITGAGATWQGAAFGATNNGGVFGEGVAYELSPGGGGSWNYQVIHDFSTAEGNGPLTGLILDSGGNLYGGNQTSIFKLSPGTGGVVAAPAFPRTCVGPVARRFP